jgi:hypothetical protein
MRVNVSIAVTELERDDGRPIDGICATCDRCAHTTESYGTHGGSVRRCLALMREECPRGEENFYIADRGGDDLG